MWRLSEVVGQGYSVVRCAVVTGRRGAWWSWWSTCAGVLVLLMRVRVLVLVMLVMFALVWGCRWCW